MVNFEKETLLKVTGICAGLTLCSAGIDLARRKFYERKYEKIQKEVFEDSMIPDNIVEDIFGTMPEEK